MLNIRNTLTDPDRVRAENVPDTPHMFTTAQNAGLQGAEFFARRFINPVLIKRQTAFSDRTRILVGLFYRLYPYARSLLKLDEPLDFQSVVSATRSGIEIYVDMELIHRDTIAQGVDKCDVFTDAQKLNAQ